MVKQFEMLGGDARGMPSVTILCEPWGDFSVNSLIFYDIEGFHDPNPYYDEWVLWFVLFYFLFPKKYSYYFP